MRTFLIGIALGILTFLTFLVLLVVISSEGPTIQHDNTLEIPLHSDLLERYPG